MNPGSRILRPETASVLREDLRRRLERHPDWVDLWNLRGLLHAWEGDPSAALTCFDEALKRNHHYGSALWNRAWIGLLLGDATPRVSPGREQSSLIAQPGPLLRVVRNLLRDAGPSADEEIADPSVAFALYAVAVVRRETERIRELGQWLHGYDPGLRELMEVARFGTLESPDRRWMKALGKPGGLNPGYAALFTAAADLEGRRGEDEEAFRLHATAALLLGNRAHYLVRRADWESRAGRAADAVLTLRDAVTLDPDGWEPHAALGYELSVQGLRAEALEAMAAAVSLQPGFADLVYQWGLLLHADDRNARAADAFRSALRINPHYHVARVALANLLFEQGQAQDALPHYEMLFDEGFESALLLGRFGYSAHRAGHRNRAEELFLEAISQDRERADLLTLYGLFLAETDRRAEAHVVWNRAEAANPDDDALDRIESLRRRHAADRR